MQIIVRDNNVEQALRALKKKLQREGVYREMKLRRHYEKPSEKRARERAAAAAALRPDVTAVSCGDTHPYGAFERSVTAWPRRSGRPRTPVASNKCKDVFPARLGALQRLPTPPDRDRPGEPHPFAWRT